MARSSSFDPTSFDAVQLADLATAIAHDLNNLLSAFVGYGALIQERSAEGSDERRWAGEILDASDRATAMTRWMLSLSRPSQLPHHYELGRDLMVMRSLFRKLLGGDIALEYDIDDGLEVEVIGGVIERVVTSVLLCARDSMSDGGAICIEGRRDDDRVMVTIRVDGAAPEAPAQLASLADGAGAQWTVSTQPNGATFVLGIPSPDPSPDPSPE